MSTASKPSCLQKCDSFLRRFSLPLIFGIFAGLIHANVAPSSYTYIFPTAADIDQASDASQYLLLIPDFKLFGEYQVTLLFVINQCFMTLFFGFVMKHVVESILPPNGSLYPLSKALSPIIASSFGIVTPISFYISFILLFNIWWDPVHPMKTILHGWAIPLSTDIALAWTVASFIFNDHVDHRDVASSSTVQANANQLEQQQARHEHGTHPCISFLLLSSIFDSIVGLVVIAVFYPKQQIVVKPIYVTVIVAAILVAFVSNRFLRIQRWWFYVFVLGTVSWIGFLLTAIHPALALIPIVPFMVIKNRVKRNPSQRVVYDYIGHNDESEVPTDEYLDEMIGSESSNEDVAHADGNNLSAISEVHANEPYSILMLNDFEKRIDRFVEYGLFFFTYANTGVHFSDFGNMTMCVFASIVLGKITGITFGGWFSVKALGIALPQGMKMRQLPLIGFCATLSLTVSLFISNIAFVENQLTNEAKLGALFAAALGMFGGILYRVIYRLNHGHAPPRHSNTPQGGYISDEDGIYDEIAVHKLPVDDL